ncbi:hypothetical protein RRG08_062611 [Elysia crispata]|uniref:Uncharacterized protein n=1 Tax=Elysia crispata TaxID=231223 RepID=A0AAE1D6Q9_9GAST|nr:hypothetical protein RRG08_062611 [Elysia crispata]
MGGTQSCWVQLTWTEQIMNCNNSCIGVSDLRRQLLGNHKRYTPTQSRLEQVSPPGTRGRDRPGWALIVVSIVGYLQSYVSVLCHLSSSLRPRIKPFLLPGQRGVYGQDLFQLLDDFLHCSVCSCHPILWDSPQGSITAVQVDLGRSETRFVSEKIPDLENRGYVGTTQARSDWTPEGNQAILWL